MLNPLISPIEVVTQLTQNPQSIKGVDVRSEGEFFQGSVPGFRNLPILNDEERHQVGLCFKIEGQTRAMELGQKLVLPHRAERVRNWVQTLSGAQWPIITCWRGGLRSQIASQWLAEQGLTTTRIEGGYKALRAELSKVFNHSPELLVITGPTGSGKTALLKEIQCPKIDLENLALHRGSAFGKIMNTPQPRQATFENNLALALLRHSKDRILIEDESLNIGQIYLPIPLKEKISTAEIVKIRIPIEERLTFLYDEYIQEPLKSGASLDSLRLFYTEALFKIRNKLGGQLTATLLLEINQAFQNTDRDLHNKWIQCLLENYYDKMYEYSFSKYSRKILYEGDWHQCKNWIQKQFS